MSEVALALVPPTPARPGPGPVPETALRALIEIGESVHRAGIEKLVIVNSHGGNITLIDLAARQLRVRHGMLAVHVSWGRFG